MRFSRFQNLCCDLFTGCWWDAHWDTCKIDQWSISATRASCLSTLGLRVLAGCISSIAMRPFVDVAECACFLKLWALDERKFSAVLSREKVESNTRLYSTAWTRRSKYAKLLRVVKYARTLKSIMRSLLLFIKVPEGTSPRKLPTFLKAVVPMITV